MTFVYLVLALMCTSVNEWIAQVLRSRAYILRVGIERLLGDPKLADKLYAHPLVQTMALSDVQPVWIKLSTRILKRLRHPLPPDHYPAYIPARRFFMVLSEILCGQGETTEHKLTSGLLERDADDPLRRALAPVLRDAGSELKDVRDRLDAWYNESMERVSGWYKRRMQFITVVVAAAITIFANADSLVIVNRLWTAPELRAQIARQAEDFARRQNGKDALAYTDADVESASHDHSGDQQEDASLLNTEDRNVLKHLVSWDEENAQRSAMLDGKANWAWLGALLGWVVWLFGKHLFGWMLTTAAVSLGAPFWFDALKKVINIRAEGRKPGEKDQEKPK
jgi:hypothetical protein